MLGPQRQLLTSVQSEGAPERKRGARQKVERGSGEGGVEHREIWMQVMAPRHPRSSCVEGMGFWNVRAALLTGRHTQEGGRLGVSGRESLRFSPGLAP